MNSSMSHTQHQLVSNSISNQYQTFSVSNIRTFHKQYQNIPYQDIPYQNIPYQNIPECTTIPNLINNQMYCDPNLDHRIQHPPLVKPKTRPYWKYQQFYH